MHKIFLFMFLLHFNVYSRILRIGHICPEVKKKALKKIENDTTKENLISPDIDRYKLTHLKPELVSDAVFIVDVEYLGSLSICW